MNKPAPLPSVLVFLAAMAVLFFGPGNFWSATWLSKWALMLGLGAAALAIWAARRTSFWHFPLLLYVPLNLLYLGVWTQNPYDAPLDPFALIAVQKNALYGLLQFSAAVVFIASVTRRWALGTGFAFVAVWAVGVTGTLMLPAAGPHNPVNNGMWFGNPSMGGCLFACLLPFVWAGIEMAGLPLRLKRSIAAIAWGVTFAAIYRTGASIPWGVLGVVTVVYMMVRFRSQIGAGFLVGAFFFGTTALTVGSDLVPNFWGDSGRFEIWDMAYNWFKLHANHWTGFGFASSQILLPIEQVITQHYYSNYWLWTHNDWLQLLIEGGYLGAACVVLTVGRLLWVSRKEPAFFGCFVGFMVTAALNYPLRMPIHAFCLALVIGCVEAYARSARALFE